MIMKHSHWRISDFHILHKSLTNCFEIWQYGLNIGNNGILNSIILKNNTKLFPGGVSMCPMHTMAHEN
jgi:hypothetical protein